MTEHIGIASWWKSGKCRCESCREAYAKYHRDYKHRVGLTKPRKTWTEEEVEAALTLYATQGLKAAVASVGASGSTITKWAKERGVSIHRPPRKFEHGTRYTYSHYRCRCAACTEANRLHMEAQREAMRARLAETGMPGRHGSRSTYNNYGCRCEPCVAANSAACAEYQRRTGRRRAS